MDALISCTCALHVLANKGARRQIPPCLCACRTRHFVEHGAGNMHGQKRPAEREPCTTAAAKPAELPGKRTLLVGGDGGPPRR
jgi:hypothetical protein